MLSKVFFHRTFSVMQLSAHPEWDYLVAEREGVGFIISGVAMPRPETEIYQPFL
jgi:hypothetical protein